MRHTRQRCRKDSPCHTEMPITERGFRDPTSTIGAASAATLSDAAAVRLRHAERSGRVGQAGGARRVDGCRGRHQRCAGVDRQRDTQRGQSGQSAAVGGDDLPRSVPRPRHDLRSDVQAGANPRSRAHPNFRTPALDLDSVYGAGPGESPHLYTRDRGGANRVPGRADPRLGSGVWWTGRCVSTAENSPEQRPARRSPNDENLIVLSCTGLSEIPQRGGPGPPR